MTQQPMRVNYFDKQFLRAEDFIDEQNYHREQVQRLASSLLSRGIVEGFEIVPSEVQGKPTLEISPGVAVDGYGRLITRSIPIQVGTSNYTNETRLLMVAYDERKPDLKKEDEKDFQMQIGGNVYFTRMFEHPRFQMLPVDSPGSDEQIPLAKITFDDKGHAQAIDPGVRIYAQVKGVSAGEAELVDTIPGDFTVKGNLRVQGQLQAGGLVQVRYADDVTGDVQITDNHRWTAVAGMSVEVNLARTSTVVCQYTINLQPHREPIELAEAPADDSQESSQETLYIVPSKSDKKVSLRQKPVINGARITFLENNEILQVIEDVNEAREKLSASQADNKWLFVRNKAGNEGYVAAWLCKETTAPAGENTSQVLNHSVYKVQQGDNLISIAVKHGLTKGGVNQNDAVQLLMEINNLSNTNIFPGQSLYIPKAPTIKPIGDDYLALRLMVDNTPYAQSASFLQPTGTLPPVNALLSGTLALPLSAGKHTVVLQWYKAGTAFASWTSATASAGTDDARGFISGRSLVITVY